MFDCCGTVMRKNGLSSAGNQIYKCPVCKKTKTDSPKRLSKAEYIKQWKKDNPDRVRQAEKTYWERHPEKYAEKKKKETERQRLARQAKKQAS